MANSNGLKRIGQAITLAVVVIGFISGFWYWVCRVVPSELAEANKGEIHTLETKCGEARENIAGIKKDIVHLKEGQDEIKALIRGTR